MKDNGMKMMTANGIESSLIEQQRAIIGSIIIRPSIFFQIKDHVRPFMFTGELRQLADIVFYHLENQIAADAATIATKYGVGGDRLITQCTQSAAASMAQTHASNVAAEYMRTELIGSLSTALDDLINRKVDYFDASAAVQSQIELLQSLLTDTESVVEIAQSMLNRMDNIRSGLIKNVSIPTGHSGLDDIIAGWNSGDLVVIMARPSMGKTTTMIYFANKVIKQDVGAAFITLEMSSDRILNWCASQRAGIPIKRSFDPRKMNAPEYEKFINETALIADRNFHIRDTRSTRGTLSGILETISMLHFHNGVRVFFVDYLQLIARDGRNEVTELSEIARKLQQLSVALDVTVILGSQLSRITEKGRGRTDPRPTMDAGRGSGGIEEAADIMIGLYRDDRYNKHDGVRYIEDDPAELLPIGVCELNVLKNRTTATLGQCYTKSDGAIIEEYNIFDDGFTPPPATSGDISHPALPPESDDDVFTWDDAPF